MSVRITRAVWEHSKQAGSNLLILLAIADMADDDGRCWPGHDTLADACRVTRRSIINSLNQVEQSGELYIDHSRGRMRSNTYFITVNIDAATLATLFQKHLGMAEEAALETATHHLSRCEVKSENVKPASHFTQSKNSSENVKFDTENVKFDTENVKFEVEKCEVDFTRSVLIRNDPPIDPLGDTERPPETVSSTVLNTKTETEIQVVEDTLVPEKTVRITRAQILDARAKQIKESLPAGIEDPPSKIELRLRAAQSNLPNVPTLTKAKPQVDKTYIKQKLTDDGHIPAGTGTNAVEIYYERFSAYNTDARLTAPQQDDLVRGCTDLAKLRAVVEEYSRRPYKARNIKLILDWYSKGIQENGNGSNRPNSTQSNQHRPANERRALGKAPAVDRNKAKEMFANHYLYQQ